MYKLEIGYYFLIFAGFVLFGAGLMFWTIETLVPKRVAPYKIQPNVKNSNSDVLWMLLLVTFNHFIALFMILFIYYFLPGLINTNNATIPNFFRFLFEIIGFAVCYDILFYTVHRILHFSPGLYQLIHKRHHKYNAPSSFAATYANPIEHIFANLIPMFAGTMIFGSHLSTTWCWLVLGLWLTSCDHSGFDFPGFSDPRIHDLHHFQLNCNYGAPGMFMDRLFGTFRRPYHD